MSQEFSLQLVFVKLGLALTLSLAGDLENVIEIVPSHALVELDHLAGRPARSVELVHLRVVPLPLQPLVPQEALFVGPLEGAPELLSRLVRAVRSSPRHLQHHQVLC